tara:strand:+ start:305 stop:1087 length:783 start_codon:yes stop_codon:yes gene_type:complete
MKKVTIKKILEKKGKEPIVCLTAYSKPLTEILDKYCDIILVGDSVGMTLYGMNNTKQVSIDTMMLHGKTVKKFAQKSLVVFDMPYKTYTNKYTAYKNAKKILKITKCDALKLEGGKEKINIIKYLIKKKIPIMGHIGLLPQSSSSFKLQGKKLLQKKKILEDAIALSNSGVFAIVIECVVEDLAKKITNNVLVPTIGIGASKHCDGQILVIDDLVGLNSFYPKFVKKYSNIKKNIEKAVRNYCYEVKKRKFPSNKHVYRH